MSSAPSNAANPAMSMISRINIQQYVVYVGFLAIFLFFAIVLKDSGFLTVRNLSNIVLQTAPITIMAIGMVFVLSAGEIDLSIGSTVAVAALCAAVTMNAYGMIAGYCCWHRRRGRHRAGERLAGRLCPAAIFPGDTGNARAVCRSGPLTHQSALHSRHRQHVYRLLRLRLAARHSLADLVDGHCDCSRTPDLSPNALRRPCAGNR